MRATSKAPVGDSQLSAIARLFSASVVRELAGKGRSSLFARLAMQSGLLSATPGSALLRSFFDEAFETLRRKDNRHAYIYKAALTQRVLLGTHSLATAAMMTEFRVGKCKADVVILNGTSTVYEIKSERDNLDRLKDQVGAYLDVFDQVNIITCENHVRGVESAVSPEVGILVLSDRFRISTVRPSRSNLNRIVPSVVFDSLQRDEARQILERCGRPVPQVPNTLICQAMKREFEYLAPEQLHRAFVDVLRTTRSSLPLREIVDAVPDSLKAATLSVPLKSCDRARLVAAMAVRLDEALAWS
jgi:hypothetical protein